MSEKDFKVAVKKFGGWIEGDMVRFPTVHQRQQFERYCAEQEGV